MTWGVRMPLGGFDPDLVQRARPVGIRVEISDLGTCVSDCVPNLPNTGFDGSTMMVLLVVAATLLLAGIALVRRRRSTTGAGSRSGI